MFARKNHKGDTMLEQELAALAQAITAKVEECLSDGEVEQDNKKELQAEYAAYVQRQPATDSQLDAVEKALGVTLPADFRALYWYKDGSGALFPLFCLRPTGDLLPLAFFLMSLKEIEECKQRFMAKDVPLADWCSPEECARLDKRIQPFILHKAWLPFAEGPGVFLMLDCDPSPAGDVGQILMYVHDPDFVYYVGKDVAAMLRLSNQNLKAEPAFEFFGFY